jgi:hypothetical protein
MTCTVIKWMALLGNPSIAGIVLDSLRFMITERQIQLHGYVLMHNHLHLIASGEFFETDIKKFKS